MDKEKTLIVGSRFLECWFVILANIKKQLKNIKRDESSLHLVRNDGSKQNNCRDY